MTSTVQAVGGDWDNKAPTIRTRNAAFEKRGDDWHEVDSKEAGSGAGTSKGVVSGDLRGYLDRTMKRAEDDLRAQNSPKGRAKAERKSAHEERWQKRHPTSQYD